MESALSPAPMTTPCGSGTSRTVDACIEAIDWDSLPITTSLTLYHRMKEEILRLRDAGTVLIRLPELNQRLELLLPDHTFTPDQLRAALKHLEGPGMIQPLEFGGFILLRPEVLSRYAAALVRKVRRHPQEMGCIFEENLLAGELDYQDFERLPREDEAVVLQAEEKFAIDNESRELLAVHHAGFIVAEAGQIYRGYTNSDHGIDAEIEFKNDDGSAAGKRLYLQLKSGDSYLKVRQRDNAEIFQIKNPRWSDYWQQQAYPVMLVIRTSDGEIRWMDVSAWLKRNAVGGKKVTQITFEGERFDALSVRRWRDRLLG